MTNRLKWLTVVFENDVREDDAEVIINAIKLIKWVIDVSPAESTCEFHFEKQRLKYEYLTKISELFN